MVDEDFVMGYVTGYNDGVGSGSGGGRFDNIPLLKKYSFVGTDYGIGIVDSNNEMFNIPYNFPNYSVYSPEKVIFCPEPSVVHRRILIAVLKNGNVVGLLAGNYALQDDIPYQYDPDTGVWNQTGTITTEKIENASVSVAENIYNNGNYVIQKLVFGYSICEYFGTKLNSTNTYTHELVSRSRSTSSSGVFISSSQYLSSNVTGCNNISNEYYRGFLSAWSDCTGLEEVI